MENPPKTETYEQPTLDQALLEQQQDAVAELRSQAQTPEDHAVIQQWEQEYGVSQASATPGEQIDPTVVNEVQESAAEAAATSEEYSPKHLATEVTDADHIDAVVSDHPNIIDNREPKHMMEAEPDSRNILIGERDPETLPQEAENNEPQHMSDFDTLPDFLREQGTIVDSTAEASGEPQHLKQELTPAEQLDNKLRQMISSYRKEKANFVTQEQKDEQTNAMQDVFGQLAKEAGWDEAETAKKQVMLFEQLAKEAPTGGFEAAVRAAGEPAEGRKAEVMDNVTDYLGGGKVPELTNTPDAPTPSAEAQDTDVLTGRNNEAFWAEAEQPRFARVRKFGRRLMELVGLRELPREQINTAAPAYEAIQRIANADTATDEPRPIQPATASSGRPTINAEQVLSPAQSAALEEEQRKLREQGETSRTVA